MVDSTFLNQTVNVQELNGFLYYVSVVPKYITESLTNSLQENGYNVSQRWSGLLLTFVSLLLIFISIKLLKKVNTVIKIFLIAIAIILLVGLVIPFW